LVNPSFEQWGYNPPPPPIPPFTPLNWYLSGAGSVSQAAGYGTDTYSALIDATNGETFLYQAYIPIRTNRTYRITCFAKPGISANGISIRLETLDSFNTPQVEFITAVYPTGGTDWQQISAEGVLSNSDSIMVQARVKVDVKAGGSAYFDDVLVEEL